MFIIIITFANYAAPQKKTDGNYSSHDGGIQTFWYSFNRY